MSEANIEQKADAENVKNIENVEKADNVYNVDKTDNVKKADVTNVEDSDDDDFYTNFETFLSKSNSTNAASNLVESSTANQMSSNEIDRQNLTEKVIDSLNNTDKVEVDLLMADIDNCLVENEVRIRLQLG
jgi:hypothetical protein